MLITLVVQVMDVHIVLHLELRTVETLIKTAATHAEVLAKVITRLVILFFNKASSFEGAFLSFFEF